MYRPENVPSTNPPAGIVCGAKSPRKMSLGVGTDACVPSIMNPAFWPYIATEKAAGALEKAPLGPNVMLPMPFEEILMDPPVIAFVPTEPGPKLFSSR
jgi:hypothetical protein